MFAKTRKQAVMTLRGNAANGTGKTAGRKNGEETKSDDRWRFDPTCGEVCVPWPNEVIEVANGMAELRARASNQPVAKRWHLAESDGRPVL